MPRFSPAILATAEPPIPAAREWASRYAGRHGPALDLTQAVPGYPPHPELLARLGEAASQRDAAGYGPIAGDDALREALAEDASRFYGSTISAAEVAITAGCNLAFAMAMTVIAEPGAEVLVPTPWYFNHEMTLRMQGVTARPLPCRAEDGFVPDPALAETLVNDRTRAILLVSPNNPTGAIYPAATLSAFAELAARRGLWLVLDETYRDFLAAAPHDLFETARENLVHLYSFSKAHCIPGHRLGAVIAPRAFQAQLAKALDSFQICPARPAQRVIAWAIPALRDWREANRRLMEERAQACRAALNHARIDALGAYFAYVRLPKDAPDAMDAAAGLAEHRGVMTLPGPFFGPGQARHLRLAFANAEAKRLAELGARFSFTESPR
ncbi:aminotransferase [Roseococcus suduntuyensis]|uniref:aspartate transaminase n=1 Tax=Roseococcus suduntuyensis TaxID=455361 RepID=A0A840AE72_9PROT|nr:aminotransferase [Roseococcus suduntuyensis]MBB3898730.1 aspartate/methionine/tyrosine aminotransferase [Roseococcus suduntuyensis]